MHGPNEREKEENLKYNLRNDKKDLITDAKN